MPAVAGAATLTVAQTFDPQTLWPNGTTAADNLNAGSAIVEPLFYIDPRDYVFKPLLAMSYELESPKSLLVRLRKGVVFSNGEPMDADAVVHSIGVFIDKTKTPAYSGIAAPIAGAKKVDDLTVRIELNFPYPAIELTLSQIYVTPPKYWNSVGRDAYGQKPIGTGPFKFESWVRDDRLVMVRNETFWGKAPEGIDKIIWRPVPDETSRFAGLAAGEFDVAMALPVASAVGAEGRSDFKIVAIPSYRITQLFLYHTAGGRAPLDDKRVRQALNYAVDKKAIIDGLFMGRALPLRGQVLRQQQVGFNKELEDYPFDPSKARQLLAEAGYANGFEATFKFPSGRFAQDREVAEAVANMLQKVGVKVKMVSLESGEYLRQMRAKELQPMGLLAIAPQDDPDFYLSLFHSTWSWAPTSNPEVDKLIELGRQETDPVKRAAVYNKLMALMKDEAPVVFLYSAIEFNGVKSGVQNYAGRGDGRMFLYDMGLKN
jgi:peptide/nickel transport system substrate-binding protein